MFIFTTIVALELVFFMNWTEVTKFLMQKFAYSNLKCGS